MENVIVFGLALLAVVVVAIYVGRQNAKEDNRAWKKMYGSPLYQEACNLEYFTRNCTFNPGNKKYIEHKLKEYRARDEMEDVVFNHKIGEIGLLFDKRCADVEPEN